MIIATAEVVHFRAYWPFQDPLQRVGIFRGHCCADSDATTTDQARATTSAQPLVTHLRTGGNSDQFHRLDVRNTMGSQSFIKYHESETTQLQSMTRFANLFTQLVY